jgi:hypothetical protein
MCNIAKILNIFFHLIFMFMFIGVYVYVLCFLKEAIFSSDRMN